MLNLEEERAIDDFEELKLKLDNTDDIITRDNIINQMTIAAQKVSHLKGWPYDKRVFWDDEAYLWKGRIDADEREFIKSILLEKTDINSESPLKILELGSGSFAYFKESVCLDISHRMLKEIETDNKLKVQANVDLSNFYLPFKQHTFDYILVPFVVNYLENTEQLIIDLKRILKPDGTLLLIQYLNPIIGYHKLLEKSKAEQFAEELPRLLKKHNYSISLNQEQFKNKRFLVITCN